MSLAADYNCKRDPTRNAYKVLVIELVRENGYDMNYVFKQEITFQNLDKIRSCFNFEEWSKQCSC